MYPIRFFIAACFLLGLCSCAEVGRDMGLEEVPDLEQRAGPTGTQGSPAVLDPFKTYNLVMAADECRFFSMKVPERWYWKVYLTAANRDEARSSRLEAEISPVDPPWEVLPAADMKKVFELKREGIQAVLGIGNSRATRTALLRLCQQGAPLHITLKSEVSSTAELIGPNKKEAPQGE